MGAAVLRTWRQAARTGAGRAPFVLAAWGLCASSCVRGPELGLGGGAATEALAQGDLCTVTYVANAGFLVATQSHKVLMDSLFGGFDGDWCDQPTEETLAVLLSGEAPFDDIDAVTISHAHVDHFDADRVASFALRNPQAAILCPTQVEERLRSHARYADFRASVIGLSLEADGSQALDVRGLPIRVLRLDHGAYLETDELTGQPRNRHRDVQNLAFLLYLDGFLVLHAGDANPQGVSAFHDPPWQQQELDIALLGQGFAFDPRAPGIDVIAHELRPRHVILMHVEPGRTSSCRAIAAEVQDRIPDLTVFEQPLSRRIYSVNATRSR